MTAQPMGTNVWKGAWEPEKRPICCEVCYGTLRGQMEILDIVSASPTIPDFICTNSVFFCLYSEKDFRV